MTPNPMNRPPGKRSALLTVSVVAILALLGIATGLVIPSFIKPPEQSKKQAECKTMLKSVIQMQQAYLAEKKNWADTAEELAFRPDKKALYSYRISPRSAVPAGPLSTTSLEQLEAGYPPGMMERLGSHGSCPDNCDVTMACAGNIDADPTIDVWSISTKQRTVNGEVVPAGTPYNDSDDLTR